MKSKKLSDIAISFDAPELIHKGYILMPKPLQSRNGHRLMNYNPISHISINSGHCKSQQEAELQLKFEAFNFKADAIRITACDHLQNGFKGDMLYGILYKKSKTQKLS